MSHLFCYLCDELMTWGNGPIDMTIAVHHHFPQQICTSLSYYVLSGRIIKCQKITHLVSKSLTTYWISYGKMITLCFVALRKHCFGLWRVSVWEFLISFLPLFELVMWVFAEMAWGLKINHGKLWVCPPPLASWILHSGFRCMNDISQVSTCPFM